MPSNGKDLPSHQLYTNFHCGKKKLRGGKNNFVLFVVSLLSRCKRTNGLSLLCLASSFLSAFFASFGLIFCIGIGNINQVFKMGEPDNQTCYFGERTFIYLTLQQLLRIFKCGQLANTTVTATSKLQWAGKRGSEWCRHSLRTGRLPRLSLPNTPSATPVAGQ